MCKELINTLQSVREFVLHDLEPHHPGHTPGLTRPTSTPSPNPPTPNLLIPLPSRAPPQELSLAHLPACGATSQPPTPVTAPLPATVLDRIAAMTNLRALDLSCREVAAEQLLKLVGKLPKLECLNLFGCPVSPGDAAALMEAHLGSLTVVEHNPAADSPLGVTSSWA